MVNQDPRHVRTTGDGFQKLSGDLKRPYEPLDPPYRNDRSFKNLTLAIRAPLGARACVDRPRVLRASRRFPVGIPGIGYRDGIGISWEAARRLPRGGHVQPSSRRPSKIYRGASRSTLSASLGSNVLALGIRFSGMRNPGLDAGMGRCQDRACSWGRVLLTYYGDGVRIGHERSHGSGWRRSEQRR